MELFKECPACAAKPGMPVLCESCLYNRQIMNNLEQEVEALKAQIRSDSDHRRLTEIKDEVISHLKDECAPLRPTNVVHAMFKLGYADWLGSESTEPVCPYEE